MEDVIMDMKIELIPVPVTNVDKSKEFYTEKMGFNADQDITVSDNIRFIQLTPPTSACSIVIGDGITEMTPGTQMIQAVIDNAAQTREALMSRGTKVSEIDKQDWGTFVYVKDPDGNMWALQQLPQKS